VSARVRYAKFLYLVGKYVDSMEEITALQGSGVKDPTLKRIEGYNLVEMKDYQNAVKMLDQYFEMQPAENVIPTDLEYYGKALSGLGNDSLAAEKTLFAARMPKADPELYSEAAKLFAKIKRYDMAVVCYDEKMKKAGLGETDLYFLGRDAYKAKLYAKSDSAWARYVEKRPDLHQGHLGRARANERIDSLKTTWQAKPFYEEVIRKIKPEDREKYKVELEEALFYLGFYYFQSADDRGMARCYFEQVRDLNAGTGNTKVGSDMLLTKELKDVAPKDCSLL
jgi:tetratricopeptide (TPR) repeat protein